MGAGCLLASIWVSDATLHSAVLAFAGFIFVGAVIDATTTSGDTRPLYGLVGTLIGTSIVVLGLLTVLGSQHPPVSVKVGALSLVAGILVGLQLLQKLIPPGQDPPVALKPQEAPAALKPQEAPAALKPHRWHRVSVEFFFLSLYVAMWSLAFGLLCIAMALAYR
jgi:hypothetical protein